MNTNNKNSTPDINYYINSLNLVAKTEDDAKTEDGDLYESLLQEFADKFPLNKEEILSTEPFSTFHPAD